MTGSCRLGIGQVQMIAIVLVFFMIGLAVALVTSASRPSAQDEERRLVREAYASLKIADFELIAATGESVTPTIFDDGWTLLSFGFTHCQLACPPMHANTIQLMTKLSTAPVRFVTISVDPVHDTPERLMAYSEKLGIDPDRWLFVAADAGARDRVLEGLAMGVTDDTSPENVIELEGGQRMNNIGHPTRFILIAPDRSIVDMYEGTEGHALSDYTSSIRSHIANW